MLIDATLVFHNFSCIVLLDLLLLDSFILSLFQVRLSDEDSSWLVPPLIDRLPNDLKAEIIAFASKPLESGNNFWISKNSQDKERFLQKSSVLLAHPPFVTLLLGCLQTGEHKMTLLNSLQAQIEKFVQNAKEADKIPDDLRVRQILQVSARVQVPSLVQRFAINNHQTRLGR